MPLRIPAQDEQGECIILTYLPLLAIAIGLGTAIGIERWLRHRVCNVSMHIYLAGASCMVAQVSVLIMHGAAATYWPLPAAVLTGVGFAAGAFINRNGVHLQGVTTGMSIFLAAGVGLVTGFGYPGLAGSATALTLVATTCSCRLFSSKGRLHSLRERFLQDDPGEDA